MSSKIDTLFVENKDNIKWEKLLQSVESFDQKFLEKIETHISKKISIKEKKILFIILLAQYLETDFVRWNAVKNKIKSFEKIPVIKSKSIFKNIFSKFYKKKEKKPLSAVINKNDKEELAPKDIEYVDMYINIGKDKRAFPNDIVRFIRGSMKIREDEIRNIRIFDKYSFFRIPKNLGDKAVILLSVKRFKGKNVVVNFSKQKY